MAPVLGRDTAVEIPRASVDVPVEAVTVLDAVSAAGFLFFSFLELSLELLEENNLRPAKVDLMLLATDFFVLVFLLAVEAFPAKLASLATLSSPTRCHTLLSAGLASDSFWLSSAAVRNEHMDRHVSSALGNDRLTSPSFVGRVFRRQVLLSMMFVVAVMDRLFMSRHGASDIPTDAASATLWSWGSSSSSC